MTDCVNLDHSFRCRAKDGTHYTDPYPGAQPLICHPVSDEEARHDWEEALK